MKLLLKLYGVKSKFRPFLHLLCSRIVGFGQRRKELVPLKQTPEIVQNQTKSRVPGDIMFLVSRRHIATTRALKSYKMATFFHSLTFLVTFSVAVNLLMHNAHSLR